jgi:HTH-type transcriptional regulator/antitoxin MqsA
MMNEPAPERICAETGAVLRRGVRPLTLTYKGRSAVIDMPGWYADDEVTESIHSGEDMKVSDRALHLLKAQAEGLLVPKDVRRIRRRLRLSQREAGLVIGGGPNAFQKYEAGDVVVSHAISSALRLLDAHPDALAILLDHRTERPVA